MSISDLYAYNRWANRRTLAATEGLTPEELHRDLGGSFPSVFDTLGHILAAEWIWLERWNGRSPTGPPASHDFEDRAGLLAAWGEHEARQAEFVEALSDAALHATIEYRNTRGEPFAAPLEQLMRHVVNHSTYHRGQVAVYFRQLGHAPASTDLVLFHRLGSPTHP